MTKSTRPAITIRADAQAGQNLLSALYDKKFETERYLRSYPDADEGPTELDSCCRGHLFRYEMREQEAESLRQRLAELKDLIEQVEPQAAEIEIEESPQRVGRVDL